MASVDCNCTDRPGWAQEFASPASYAYIGIDNRHRDAPVGYFHHFQGSRRAVARAVTAFDAPFCHAQAAVDGCSANVILRFFFGRDSYDRPARAKLRTLDAFRAAVSVFEAHFRLHQAFHIRRGAQHLIRAARNTQLAGGTATIEILYTS